MNYIISICLSAISSIFIFHNTNVTNALFFISNDIVRLLLLSTIIFLCYLCFFLDGKRIYKSIFGLLGILIFGIAVSYKGQLPMNMSALGYVEIITYLLGIYSSFGLVSSSILEKVGNWKMLLFLCIVVAAWKFQKESPIFNKTDGITVLYLNMAAAAIFSTLLFIKNKLFLSIFKNGYLYFIKNKKDILYEIIIIATPFYLFAQDMPPSTIEAAIILGILSFFIIRHRKMSTTERNILILVALIIIGSCITMYFNDLFTVKESVRRYRSYIKAYLFLASMMFLIFDKIKINAIISVGAIVSLIPSFCTILLWVGAGYAPARYGVKYFTLFGATAAVYICIFVFMWLYYNRTELIGPIIINAIALVLTGSRMSMISCVFTVILIGMLRYIKDPKKAAIFFFICGGIIFGVMSSSKWLSNRFLSLDEDVSALSRIYIYEEGFYQFKDHILFGNGFETYRSNLQKEGREIVSAPKNIDELAKNQAYRIGHSHNNILEMFRANGVFGGILYLMIHIYIIFICLKNYLKSKKYFYLMPIFLFITLEISGLVNLTMCYGREAQLIAYMFSGIIIGYKKTTEIKGESSKK